MRPDKHESGYEASSKKDAVPSWGRHEVRFIALITRRINASKGQRNRYGSVLAGILVFHLGTL